MNLKYPLYKKTDIELGLKDMTIEYAIQWTRNSMCFGNYNGIRKFYDYFRDERCIAGEIAIKAMKNQIPHKVNMTEFYNSALCPSCRELFERSMDNWGSPYCQYCGVKLDWSEEE